MNSVKGLAKVAVKQAFSLVTKREFEAQEWRKRNERPIEYGFSLDVLRDECPKSVLDVGTGTTAWPSLLRTCGYVVTAIDNVEDYWPAGMFNRHWHVLHDDIRAPKSTEKHDAITCLSVLEHIEESDAAVRGMFSLLNPGGSLIITCPYKEDEYVKNAYELPKAGYGHNAPYICQQYDRAHVDRWLAQNNAELVQQTYWRFFDGKYWTEGNALEPPKKVRKTSAHQVTCIHMRKPRS